MGEVLSLVRKEVDVPSEPTDRERGLTDRLEETIARQAAQEQALFGSLRDGKRVPGLFDGIERLESTVSRVTGAVAELTVTVATISARVSGESGLGVEVREIKRDLVDLKDDLSAKHTDNLERQKKIEGRIIVFFSVFGFGMFLLIARSVQIALQGHL